MPQSFPARLMIGASEHSADLLYATRMFVPDPFVWLQTGRKTLGVFSALEVDRARGQARLDEVMEQSQVEALLKRPPAAAAGRFLHSIAALLRSRRIRTVEVPYWTEAGLVEFLRSEKIRVEIVDGPFFPGREIKTEEEVRAIIRGQRQAEAGMARAFEVLRACSEGNRRLLRWNGRALTSEILRGEIDAAVVRAGGIPGHTIVAGGLQGCDPHERGHGPLRAHEALILDIFPRDQSSGYFGDLTRTVVKGRASEALRRQYATVLAGQKKALRAIKAGVDGAKLHQSVKDFFTSEGYPTEQREGRWVGFFHGTGHSLGLEIHEPPRFAAGKFKAGHVMTVEPGLYYPETGGVRIEDLVTVTRTGHRNLTRTPKFLEI
ncbi:MAG: Xaa-Pro peptidase family protein [Candidatus Methylacidiphilales bacterium]|nr:Xaa-Pro peptidase family protein [Candidatus Methylacidiphilales bacterium]